MILALLGLALAQATVTVRPADVAIPDPWRPSDQSPLPNEVFRDCKSGDPVTEGVVQAVVEIHPGELRFAGQRVAPHGQGRFPEHLVDQGVLVPLRDRLERARRDLAALKEQGCAVAEGGVGSGRLVLAVDQGISYATIRTVVASAQKAGFVGFDFLVGPELPVRSAAKGQPVPRSTSDLAVTLTPAADARWSELRVELALVLDANAEASRAVVLGPAGPATPEGATGSAVEGMPDLSIPEEGAQVWRTGAPG